MRCNDPDAFFSVPIITAAATVVISLPVVASVCYAEISNIIAAPIFEIENITQCIMY
jgi:hypothetical protein